MMVVALYARVSTPKQVDKDLSIPDQLNQMRDWCVRNGHSVAAEYVEAGASATDARRPEFQKMIAEACAKPSPIDAIIVHSLSRFFRDDLEFGLYERELRKYQVKIISITQQTPEDSIGEMARKFFSLFDAYQSKENSKHTMRAMKENARQGFFNGSTSPFGYKAVSVSQKGRNGNKKRLVIEPAEADVVRRIFDLYLGEKGHSMGIKGVAAQLNQLGVTYRGRKWSRNNINSILANTAYVGDYFFNRTNHKNRQEKPVTEWIQVNVPPIVTKDIFERAKLRREERQPANTNPATEISPTLLTGLLVCGECGAGMTLATGKGGRYRYYKCTNRINKGNTLCSSRNIPMEKFDAMILNVVSEKIFSPSRVLKMMKGLQQRLGDSLEKHESMLCSLRGELAELKKKMDRLCEGLENGVLPADVVRERSQMVDGRRQVVLAEIAGLQRQQEITLGDFSPQRVQAFCVALKKKLFDSESNFGKAYLKLLIEEIWVGGNEVRLKGRVADLAGAIKQTALGLTFGVPRAGHVWLPTRDSHRNFFRHHFSFMLSPVKKNHPRTEYRFQRMHG